MNYDYLIKEAIIRYKEMRLRHATGMYREAMMQYKDMAEGGDGGELGYWPDDWAQKAVNTKQPVIHPTSRSYYYPGYPDMFFQKVLDGLGESL